MCCEEKEIWRKVPGYPDYQVSNKGCVLKNGQVTKGTVNDRGYRIISLGRRTVGIHRLVLWAFVGPQGNMYSNHKNLNTSDNRLCNLEYVTPSENLQHAYDNGVKIPTAGELNGMSKLNKSDVIEIRNFYERGLCTRKELVKIYPVAQTQICRIVNYQTWRNI